MEKKTKLTISGSAKKSIRNIEIAKSQGKNSRVIEKQGGKFANRGGSFRPGVGKPKSSTDRVLMRSSDPHAKLDEHPRELSETSLRCSCTNEDKRSAREARRRAEGAVEDNLGQMVYK